MATQTILELLEQQVTQMPMRDQLKLIARISERLSVTPLGIEKQHAVDANEVLALCDAAADMWNGKFDAAQEIRQMRQEREEQIWPSKS
ncbi:MAG: hypothetical protein DDT21_02323 [Syntrophomonadaceae bacterium]|nr:hypothetical protein [Bacillota bacterium]